MRVPRILVRPGFFIFDAVDFLVRERLRFIVARRVFYFRFGDRRGQLLFRLLLIDRLHMLVYHLADRLDQIFIVDGLQNFFNVCLYASKIVQSQFRQSLVEKLGDSRKRDIYLLLTDLPAVILRRRIERLKSFEDFLHELALFFRRALNYRCGYGGGDGLRRDGTKLVEA